MKSFLDTLFQSPAVLDDRGRRIWKYSVVILFGIGVIHWAIFFDLGQLKFNFHDWGLTAHYLRGLEQAVKTAQLPLHVFPEIPTHRTVRFLANPELRVSPQVLLIPLVGLGRFVLLDALILYGLGFIGLYMLAKRYELSVLSFALLVALFNFNGHITAHVGVGHFVWLAYFLLSFVVFLVLEAADRGANRKWPVLISLVLFAIVLQGGFHFVIYSTLLLLLIALSWPPLRRSALVAVLLTAALSAVRFIPAAFEFGSAVRRYVGGFKSVDGILIGLSVFKTPFEADITYYGPTEWWEVDYFVGVVGLLALAAFGFAYWIRHAAGDKGRIVRVLAPGLIVMTFLSLDFIFRAIANLPIPLIRAENVSSRFFILPFLFLVVFCVIALQRWMDAHQHGRGIKILLIAGLLAIALDLWQHSRVWRPSAAQLGFDLIYPNFNVGIQNRPDPEYINALLAGAAITLIALGYCIWRLVRDPHRDDSPHHSSGA